MSEIVRMAQAIHTAKMALMNLNLDSPKEPTQRYIDDVIAVLEAGLSVDEWFKIIQSAGNNKQSE